jgi:hypothetical protein
LQCRNCGDHVDPRRVDLGYDYCLKEECQRRCVERVQLAAVAVNKAADYYSRADEVAAVEPPAPSVPVDGDEPAGARRQRSRPAGEPDRRRKTTLERLRDQEVELDEALLRSYERFCRGEITAREMDRECDRLVEVFNQQVMSENIRYRSMLRPRNGVSPSAR